MIYLYVKQHSTTGMLYFGKTTKDPFTYNGSGLYWLKHITKHGKKLVKTIQVWHFEETIDAKEFAQRFSIENDIVNSSKWANLRPEELDGGDTSKCQKYIVSMANRDLSGKKNPMFGRSAVTENNLKWYTDGNTNLYITENTQPKGFRTGRANLKRKPHTQYTKNKMSSARLLKGKSVISPDGEIFKNRQLAAISIGCSPAALTEKIRRGKSGWKFTSS